MSSLNSVSPQPAHIIFYPIASAPKDGTAILVETAPGVVQQAHWDDEFRYVYLDEEEGFVYQGAWTTDAVASWNDQERVELGEPLRWAPMPAVASVSEGAMNLLRTAVEQQELGLKDTSKTGHQVAELSRLGLIEYVWGPGTLYRPTAAGVEVIGKART